MFLCFNNTTYSLTPPTKNKNSYSMHANQKNTRTIPVKQGDIPKPKNACGGTTYESLRANGMDIASKGHKMQKDLERKSYYLRKRKSYYLRNSPIGLSMHPWESIKGESKALNDSKQELQIGFHDSLGNYQKHIKHFPASSMPWLQDSCSTRNLALRPPLDQNWKSKFGLNTDATKPSIKLMAVNGWTQRTVWWCFSLAVFDLESFLAGFKSSMRIPLMQMRDIMIGRALMDSSFISSHMEREGERERGWRVETLGLSVPCFWLVWSVGTYWLGFQD